MGKKSRTKGAAAENEVCKMLRHIFPGICRELDQYQDKLGRDLRGCDPWSIQVKRYRHLTQGDKDKAFEEAESACDDSSWLFPLVFYREDRHQWRVYTSLEVLLDLWAGDACTGDMYDGFVMVDMDAQEFIEWVGNRG